jgi:hypothetical protein
MGREFLHFSAFDATIAALARFGVDPQYSFQSFMVSNENG